MKFDIHAKPEPLVFGEGEQAFSLILKQITGPERMAILDAARSGSLEAVQSAIGIMVLGWEGVVYPDGNPVPFSYQDDDRVRNRLNEFLGAISIKMQLRVITGLLVYLGVPVDDVEGILKAFGDDEGVDLSPTPPPESATPTSASGG